RVVRIIPFYQQPGSQQTPGPLAYLTCANVQGGRQIPHRQVLPATTKRPVLKSQKSILWFKCYHEPSANSCFETGNRLDHLLSNCQPKDVDIKLLASAMRKGFLFQFSPANAIVGIRSTRH